MKKEALVVFISILSAGGSSCKRRLEDRYAAFIVWD